MNPFMKAATPSTLLCLCAPICLYLLQREYLDVAVSASSFCCSSHFVLVPFTLRNEILRDDTAL